MKQITAVTPADDRRPCSDSSFIPHPSSVDSSPWWNGKPRERAKLEIQVRFLAGALRKDEGGRMKDEADHGNLTLVAFNTRDPIHPSAFIPHPSIRKRG